MEEAIGYVTIEEADSYVTSHYVESSDERALWEDLDESDKKVLLLVSFEAIERLSFPGRKTKASQPYTFPRYPSTEVPSDVKAAQIENALSMTDTSESDELKQYEKMWGAGVSSYSIGSLSETMAYAASSTAQSSLSSPKAKKLLIPYLSGGFRI